MNYAPESGSEAVLKRIKKKVKLPRLEDSMRAAIRRGLSVKMNMIFAFPEDTPRDIWENFKFGIRCAWLGVHDSSFSLFVPYPGSELYQKLVDEKRLEPMSDDYFNSLIPFADLEHARSFNPNISDRQLIWIRFIYFVVFYGTMYLRRPQRLVRLIMNLFTGRAESRGEEVLLNLLLRRKQVKQDS